MSNSNKYKKIFVIISNADIKKLKKGQPVVCLHDDAITDAPMYIVTEKGYKKIMDFFGDEDDQMLLHDPITDIIDES